MSKKVFNNILRLGISVAAIFLVFWSQRAHLGDAFKILKSDVLWQYVFFAILIYVGALAIISLRLRYVFRVQKIHLNFRETFYLTWIGLFFNLFLPSAVGGDIAKIYYVYKHSGSKIHATMAVIWDRILGFATLITMAMISLLVFYKELNDPRLDYMVVIFVVFFAVLMLLFLSRRFAKPFKGLHKWIPSAKVRHALSETYHAMHAFRSRKKILAASLGLSFFGQSAFILVHYFLARSIGISINVWLFFILIPLLSIITMAPSLGGLGVREAAVVYLFQHYAANERALALSLILDILLYTLSFAGGILFAFKGGLKAKALHEMESMNS